LFFFFFSFYLYVHVFTTSTQLRGCDLQRGLAAKLHDSATGSRAARVHNAAMVLSIGLDTRLGYSARSTLSPLPLLPLPQLSPLPLLLFVAAAATATAIATTAVATTTDRCCC
jgi:hypothetical protein